MFQGPVALYHSLAFGSLGAQALAIFGWGIGQLFYPGKSCQPFCPCDITSLATPLNRGTKG